MSKLSQKSRKASAKLTRAWKPIRQAVANLLSQEEQRLMKKYASVFLYHAMEDEPQGDFTITEWKNLIKTFEKIEQEGF